MYVKLNSLVPVTLLLLYLVSATAQDNSSSKSKPLSKKTSSGFEVFLHQVSSVTDRDQMNNVPVYRYGSCPPGAVLSDMKLLASNGNDVIIIRLGLKVLLDYRGGNLSLPVLIDDAGKKYNSRNTMLSDSLPELLQRQKGADDQLQCEFPFEVPVGTRVKRVQFDEALLDVTLENRSSKQP